MDLTLGVIGVLIVLAALMSRAAERGPWSAVMAFVGLGLALGGIGVFRFPVESPVVVLAGIVTLTLTLFTDAIKMQTEQLRRDWRASFAVLGPGTILTAAAIAVTAHLLLDFDLSHALLIGAVLASTDPVLLRDVFRDARTPRAVRQILSVESGMNDAVALPAILILIEVLGGRLESPQAWFGFAVPVFFLSPLVGIGIGWGAIRALVWVDRRIGVRRDYQSLYSLGVAFIAFAVADALGGSGLLAAFAAGLTIALTDLDLCECFLEYGETTAELLMLVAFVLFGSSLVRPALNALDWRTAAFAALVLVLCRPIVLLAVLSRFRIPRRDKLFAAWHGPRGLNSILLALLVLVAGVPGGERVFAVTGIVVLLSIVVHGVSGTPMVAWASQTPPSELFEPEAPALDVPRTSVTDLAGMLQRRERVLVVDVRKPGDIDRDPRRIPTAVHYPPDEAAAGIAALRPTGPIVLYCA